MTSTKYVTWSETKAKARQLDPRTDAERAAGKAVAQERLDAYMRGHQLAEMRQAASLSQADTAPTTHKPIDEL